MNKTVTASFGKFRVKRNVTLPIMKIDTDKEYYIKVTDKIFMGKEIDGKDENGEKKKPVHLMNVVNLETGELCQIVLNHVFNSTLEEDYPDGAYVGLCFAIVKHKKESGKKYNKFSISEIEIEEESVAS